MDICKKIILIRKNSESLPSVFYFVQNFKKQLVYNLLNQYSIIKP